MTTDIHPTRVPMRERVLRAASEMTSELGWSRVTMAAIGDRIGVSRQTVYNEVGSKPALAEAMVLRELGIFLAGVEEAFDFHPDNLASAIHRAVVSCLEFAQTNALLGAIISVSYGAGTDLLPLLTTRSDALLEVANEVVLQHVRQYEIDVEPARLVSIVDLLVRAVLSHVMQPRSTAEETAEELTWMVSHLIDGPHACAT